MRHLGAALAIAIVFTAVVVFSGLASSLVVAGLEAMAR
jgi:hypothetical protein